MKVKEEKKEIKVVQQTSQKVVQVIQTQQQSQIKVKNEQQPQQIFLSLSQLNNQQQNKRGAIYTLPIVLSPNGSFVSGNDMQNLN